MTLSNGLAAFGSSVRWGILSAGKISSDFAKAIAITEGAECAAVAARNGDKASEFAKLHNIPKSYGSYDELLSDPTIDVVYVGSIADQHAKMTKKCLLAGKPTVVEKPLTLTAAETTEIVQLAKKQNLFLTEGMWTRFFPAMQKVSEVIASGEIGEIVNVQGDFGWNNVDCPFPEDRIWNPLSGGMTYDIGMYMAHLGQVAYPDSEVEMIQAMATYKNGIDQTILANMMYTKNSEISSTNDETGRKGMLQFYVTGAANTEERVTIQGSLGRIVLDSPAHVPEKVRVFKDAGRGKTTEEVFDYPLPDDSYTTWYYPGSIGFTHEIKGVCDALVAGKKECPQFTWNNSIQLATVIDEIISQTRGKHALENAESDVGFDEEKVSA
jgi:dihydrodiol dehydrogenase / D-xylose 1-dehydrogenase (NADP)